MKKNICILILLISIVLSACSDKVTSKSNEKVEDSNKNKKVSTGIYDFPENYKKDFNNIRFDTKIMVKNIDSFVNTTATLQVLNHDKALETFFKGEDAEKINDIDCKNEKEEPSKYIIYENKDGVNLTLGSISSRCSFYSKKLYPYVTQSFRIQKKDAKYNLNKYSLENEFSFKTREEAFKDIKETLHKIGIEIDDEYKAYALDYKTMKEEEYAMAMDGSEDRSHYKHSWSEEDNSYYFIIGQKYKELPVYHVYHDEFKTVSDENAPIQVLYSQDGIEYIDIEKMFNFQKSEKEIILCPFEEIANTVVNKYENILGDSSYNVVKSQLYYMVDTSAGKGIYEVYPVWILNIEESTSSEGVIENTQIIIDAETAEEII